METLLFTVDSALLSELGEKLVETVHIALLELVKNAYDADATHATVKIINNAVMGTEIIISDNGSGMSFQEVQNYWMRIATTNKLVSKVSARFGRPRTGSKGIGRFSCRRLGSQLILKTTSKNGKSYETTEVTIDWKSFVPGSDLTTIECPGRLITNAQDSTGTTLVITGSQTDEWTRRGLFFLTRQLAVLVANRGARRPGFEEDPGFNVILDAPGLDQRTENLRDRLLTAGWADVSGEVDEKGRGSFVMHAQRIGSKTITYPEICPDLAGVTLKFGLLINDSKQMRDKHVLSLGILGKILDEWGGIYVRHGGFRVYPFGEPGNDWLDIDRDRGTRRGSVPSPLEALAQKLRGVDPQRALLTLISHKQHVGDVEIPAGASGFEMKASREGFLDTESFQRLKRFVRFAIDWATLYRDYSLRLAIKEEAEEARDRLKEQLKKEIEPERLVEKAIEYVGKEVKNLVAELPAPQRQQITRSVAIATEAIAKHAKSDREELRHLRLIASTSTLLLIFSHEVKSFLGNIEQTVISLGAIEKALSGEAKKKVQDIRAGLRLTKSRFVDLLDMTSLVAVVGKPAKAERIALALRAEKAKQCFDLICNAYGILIDLRGIPKDITVGPLLEAELYAILLNILSNSIKSVIAAGRLKKIEIQAARKEGKTFINIRDTGLGVSPKYYEEVFIPFVADPEAKMYSSLSAHLNPEDQYIVGTGSGLGLSIVREIVAFRGGTARFVEPIKPWIADLEIALP